MIFARLHLIVSLLFAGLPFMNIDRPLVNSPRPGQALQGVVSIDGSTDIPGFQSSEVAFAYQNEEGGTTNWFVLAQSQEALQSGSLAAWDTTTITDGAYSIRVQVWLQDGRLVETIVPDLRVRNYTAVETETPSVGSVAEPAETAPPVQVSVTPAPTASPLPPNPAEVTPAHLLDSIQQGAGAVLIGMIVLGVYLGARRFIRR
jgi:hypothetical protein